MMSGFNSPYIFISSRITCNSVKGFFPPLVIFFKGKSPIPAFFNMGTYFSSVILVATKTAYPVFFAAVAIERRCEQKYQSSVTTNNSFFVFILFKTRIFFLAFYIFFSPRRTRKARRSYRNLELIFSRRVKDASPGLLFYLQV